MGGLTAMASAIDQSIDNIWPVNGVTLEEARRLIMGEEFYMHIRQTRDVLPSVPDMSFATKLAAFDVLHWPFFDQLRIGPYRVVGRKGSPTRRDSPIPRSAWAYLRVHDWRLWRVFEPDGTIWFDIRVWREDQIGAPTEGVPIEPPPVPRKLTTKEWLIEEVDRRAVGHKPIPAGIGEFAGELHEEMKRAKADGVVAKVVSAGRIENVLREHKLWPLKNTLDAASRRSIAVLSRAARAPSGEW
jgi:hypothetical protein